jgi:hypothetical protein
MLGVARVFRDVLEGHGNAEDGDRALASLYPALLSPMASSTDSLALSPRQHVREAAVATGRVPPAAR